MTIKLIHGDCIEEMQKLIGGGAKSGFNHNRPTILNELS